MGGAAKTSLTCRAYAKINFSLEILGKRPDGYHEIVTVMQTVGLHDLLIFGPSEELILVSDDPEMTGHDNLILRAAWDLQKQTGVQKGARVELRKAIPLAAGLGGGSSDAACTLRALNRLWNLNLPIERLSEIGVQVGSDVPFFFYGGLALVEGRGERVTPLRALARRPVLLVCPRVQMADKTRVLYSKVKPSDYSDGRATRHLVESLRQGQPVASEELVNVFLPIVLNENQVVRACFERMRDAGAKPMLSGAGPTLFALLDDEAEGRRIKESLRDLNADVFITYTVGAEEVFANDTKDG